CFLFCSSRRRHTRFSRDWSSDVCSSDLAWVYWIVHTMLLEGDGNAVVYPRIVDDLIDELIPLPPSKVSFHGLDDGSYVIRYGDKIGRASCRERRQTEGERARLERKRQRR